jgi:hypothetical protein
VLPAPPVSKSSAEDLQVNGTILQPLLPNMREAVLDHASQQHAAAVFEQQKLRVAEFEQNVNCLHMCRHHRSTVTTRHFIITLDCSNSSDSLAKLTEEALKMTKRRAKPALL